MAIISNKYNLLFSLNPRTGSTALSECLIENYDGQKLLTNNLVKNKEFLDSKHIRFTEMCQNNILDPIAFKRLIKFTTIRNPFDSVVSAFFNKVKYLSYLSDPNFFINDPLRIKANKNIYKKGELEILKQQDFNLWIKFMYENCPSHKKTNNQLWIMYADFVLKFENLQEDFNSFCKSINIPQSTIKITNTNKRNKDYRIYYNDESVALVTRVFENDYFEFGYTF